MKAIIPMAGVGTRLYPHTYTKPKVLIRVGSKPMIAQIIDRLIAIGVTEVIPVLGVMGEIVLDYLKKHYPNIRIRPVYQEDQKGLGHAVLMAKDVTANKPAIIVYGDTIVADPLKGLIDRTVDGVIGVKEVDDPRRLGIAILREGCIIRLVEKPKDPSTNLAIIGMNYIRNTKLLFNCIEELIRKGVTTDGEYQITDAFQLMVNKGAVLKTFHIKNWLDCGIPETLLSTNRFLLAEEKNRYERKGCLIIPPVFIHRTARIKHSVVGPDVSIGEKTVVEKSIVEDSIIGDRTRIQHCILKHSIVGDFVEIVGQSQSLNLGDSSAVAVRT